MPEYPDLEMYVDAFERMVVGQRVRATGRAGISLLKTVSPGPDALVQRKLGASRIGKRLALHFDGDIHAVIHLMIAGRFRWRTQGKAPLASQWSIKFERGTLYLAEVSKKKRARLYIVEGQARLSQFAADGIDPFANLASFRKALATRNHTIKRALTDQRLIASIGNAYSDEILFDARLSPIKWTSRLTPNETRLLHRSTQRVLTLWRKKLIAELGDAFAEKVTAFRPGMNVHGRFKEPCHECETPIQRLRRADNECNYCPTCQTGGKVLRDRSLSRLLRDDWPSSVDELEAHPTLIRPTA